MFNNKATNGKKTKVKDSDDTLYEDDNFYYAKDGVDLIITDKSNAEYITIENFHDGAMGIGLETDGDDKNKIITCNLYVSPKNKKVA